MHFHKNNYSELLTGMMGHFGGIPELSRYILVRERGFFKSVQRSSTIYFK